MPDYGNEDQFEDYYRAEFAKRMAHHGLVLDYRKDRVGIDIGFHLTDKHASKHSVPFTNTKVWFQLKGKHAATLSTESLQSAATVAVPDIRLDHLRFWYAQPEAVYLAVYLEATDEFLLEDSRDIVDRQWGLDFFSASTFKPGQQTVTVHVARDAVMTDTRLAHLLSHRSMRIDGPQWRGRPLGHRMDPLRSSMKPMEPGLYRNLIERLLDAHGYEELEQIDIAGVFAAGEGEGENHATLSFGRMHYTYEFTHSLFTEFGFDPGETFRIEGAPIAVQGTCAVLVQDLVGGAPMTKQLNEVAAALRDRGATRLLVFANADHEPKDIGSYRIGALPLECLPQDLNSLPYSVLTCTSVFMDFRDVIEWDIVNYLH